MESLKNITDYEIWHDESKKGGYYHGLLFVPVSKKQDLLNSLKRIRDEHGIAYDTEIKFSGCLKQGTPGRFVRNQLSLFKHVIKTNPKDCTKLYNRSEKDKYEGNFEPFLKLCEKYRHRFGLLRIKNIKDSLDYFHNYRKKVETTFRFVVKGCCHGMFDRNSPIRLKDLHFDGNNQYKGDLDAKRILKGRWRQYCRIDDNLQIDDKHMSERESDAKLIMNFVDNVVGAWRARINGKADPKQYLYPLKELHQRARDKKIFSNTNSRWYRSISLSEFTIRDGEPKFPDLFRNPNQQSLF